MTEILVFDGDCGFCTTVARWIEDSWEGDLGSKPVALAWQLAGPKRLTELGLSKADARAAAWWIDEGGTRYRGHAAIGKALAASGSKRWRLVGETLQIPPFSWAAGTVYPLAARWRHRLPGATPACNV